MFNKKKITGEVVNEIRKRKKIKIKYFENNGFSKSNYYRFVSQKSNISLNDFYKIIDILKITPNEFNVYSESKSYSNTGKNFLSGDYQDVYNEYLVNGNIEYLIAYYGGYIRWYLTEHPNYNQEKPIIFPLGNTNEIFDQALKSELFTFFELNIFTMSTISGRITDTTNFKTIANRILSSLNETNPGNMGILRKPLVDGELAQGLRINIFNFALDFECFDIAQKTIDDMASNMFNLTDYYSLTLKKYAQMINLILDDEIDKARKLHEKIIEISRTLWPEKLFNQIFNDDIDFKLIAIEGDFDFILKRLEPMIKWNRISKNKTTER